MLIVAGAIAAPLLATGPGIAHAASVAPATSNAAILFPLHRTANVPRCIAAWSSHSALSRSIHVKNNCGRAYKIKIDWRGVSDSGCWHLSRGEQEKSSKSKFLATSALVKRC
ncbi:hypothetical protein ACFWY5_24035 [Nonomuraea sp. NPDC059007]|uniref:hypothetical protein n=1 Tax=Nonomuraea sp. NPDC059007 TaxID=3346692 RepID=UPI003686D7E0